MQMHPTFLNGKSARRALGLCLTLALLATFAPAAQASDGWSDVDETYSDIRSTPTWRRPPPRGYSHVST